MKLTTGGNADAGLTFLRHSGISISFIKNNTIIPAFTYDFLISFITNEEQHHSGI
jgi:hypothetical protein